MFNLFSGLEYRRDLFEWDYLGRYVVSMIIQAIVFFSFNLLVHYKTLPQCNSSSQVSSSKYNVNYHFVLHSILPFILFKRN